MNEFDRASGLGGTDVAAILGLSPYADKFDVQAEKLGLRPPKPQTRSMRAGQVFETAMVILYEEETGVATKPGGIVRHRRFPFLYGHPDRRIPGGILEAKKRADPFGWGEPGTDQIPPDVRIQLTWYTGLSRRRVGHVIRLNAVAGIDTYVVDHNPVLYDGLVDAAAEFWERHIVERRELELDGSEGAWRQVRREAGAAEDEVVATLEQKKLVDEYFVAKEQLDAAAKQVELAKQRVAQSLGEHKALVGPGFKGAWQTKKGNVDHEAVIVRLHERVIDLYAALEIVAPATRPTPIEITQPNWWQDVRKPTSEPFFEIRKRKAA